MCGLSGIVVTNPELIPMVMVKAIFSLLMEENDSRGGHSWGAWGTNTEPVRGLGKYMPNSKEFHKHFKDFQFASKGEPTFIFGHTRFGTHGGRTVENSHPFEVSGLILAHNGVVNVDGMTSKDHEVDSGQIAMSIVQNGWADGMSKVSGSCALLVSVQNTPMIYRHDQILHYAAFDWGTVICSLKSDLELVLISKLGMEPQVVKEAAVDAFTQPGWGAIYEAAPAKAYKTSMVNAWRGHWDDSWAADGYAGDYGYGGSYKGYTQPRRYEKPTGLYGEGATQLKTIDSKRKPHTRYVPKESGDTDSDTEVDPVGIIDAEIVKDRPSLLDEEEVQLCDICEYCDHTHSTDDLFRALPGWALDQDMLMCIDCIIDEILTTGICNILGNYGSIVNAPNEEEWRHMQ